MDLLQEEVVRGMQEGDGSVKGQGYQMVSMSKHFVDYTLEGCAGGQQAQCAARGPSAMYPDRHAVNVNVTSGDQMEFFLVPWRAAVHKNGGRLGGMMW